MKIQGVPEERYLNKESKYYSDKNQKLQNADQRSKEQNIFPIQINTTFRLVSNFYV